MLDGDQFNNISVSFADAYRIYTPVEGKTYVTTCDLVDADEYAQAFLYDTRVCDASGEKNNVTSENWSNQATAYAALRSDKCRGYLSGATAKTAEEGGTYVEQVAARYEYIIHKYGSVAYNDFMGRFGGAIIPPLSATFAISQSQTDSTYAIVITAVAVAFCFVGVYFLLKKKHN